MNNDENLITTYKGDWRNRITCCLVAPANGSQDRRDRSELMNMCLVTGREENLTCSIVVKGSPHWLAYSSK